MYSVLNNLCLLFESKLLRFSLVGSVGFLIDAGLLTILMNSGLGVFSSRMFSFSTAVSVTWILNRFLTFKIKNTTNNFCGEYFLYALTQVIGAAINIFVFFVTVDLYPNLLELPLIPLAFGALMSLLFNYFISNKFVFNRRDHG